MRNTIAYRHWQPGDDDAVLELLLSAGQFGVNRNHYEKKFDDGYLEPEGVRLASVGERVVGHVTGSLIFLSVEGKNQDFGMVTEMFVAPDMRRRGIATRLMLELNAYLEGKGSRGSILYVDTTKAYQLYQKVGYQEITRELQTQLSPRPNFFPLKWAEVDPEDFDVLHRLKQIWANQNFPVYWSAQHPQVHQYNLKQYRVLRRETDTVGYAKWDNSSERRPNGLIWDPVVPGEDPVEVIKSVQAAIPMPYLWRTVRGSRYENPLSSLGHTLEPLERADMLLSFGPEIDWTGLVRAFWQ
ncbi:MAG: GNAT family N-acetyltransferase [Candidatus Poribacteria bacterium]|nr:GNAT family N-acetyltransferase [Candidatus Poribacteria bacterium]